MATLFKKQFTKPIPDGAQIMTRKVKGQNKQFEQWTDRRGKRRTAELTDSGNRIKVEATTWTAKYRDGEVCSIAISAKAHSLLVEIAERDAASFTVILEDVLSKAENSNRRIKPRER